MGRHDWYRNAIWNDAIERAFYEKLGRAREKHQYLRVQAQMLERSNPEAALRLIDVYISLNGDYFDHALVMVVQSHAHHALGRFEDAVQSLESALAREASFPNSLTSAYVELPLLVAIERLEKHYAGALDLLESNRDRPQFPIERYWWHGARALIFDELRHERKAVQQAQLALEAATKQHSGLRYHADIGLVQISDDKLAERLRQISQKLQ